MKRVIDNISEWTGKAERQWGKGTTEGRKARKNIDGKEIPGVKLLSYQGRAVNLKIAYPREQGRVLLACLGEGGVVVDIVAVVVVVFVCFGWGCLGGGGVFLVGSHAVSCVA